MLNWYGYTLTNLHIDNHSDIVGRDRSTEELTELFRTVSVDVVQVSAMGNRGTALTYPSERLPHLIHPELGDYDMIGRFRDAIRAAGKRFFIYINTRGLGLDTAHPDWVQRDAAGAGSNFRGGNDMCARPTPDGRGFLELELLPLLAELTERYEPDGFWVDGDHARLPACYCDNCREAFRRAADLDAPVGPDSAGDSGTYREWMGFQLARRDEYKMMMADAVHRIRPEALYCSNHSFRNTYTAAPRNIDPRSAPDWIGYLSADLSHGDAIRQTRIMAMSLAPEEETGHDIMHLVSTRVPPRRFLQQGALTIASGSPWFLWGGHTFVDSPEDQANVRRCAEFAAARRGLLLPDRRPDGTAPEDTDKPLTVSANPIAVLASESIWRDSWSDGHALREAERANSVALGLQDAGFPVDLVNERIVRARCGLGVPKLTDDSLVRTPYSVVVAPERTSLLPETVEVLDELAEGGATIVPLPEEPIADPDWGGAAARLVAEAGVGAAIRVEGTDRHLIFSMRRRPGALLLHVVDLTTLQGGRRVLPSVRDGIDDDAAMHSFRLSLAVTSAPGHIDCLPRETSVSANADDRTLTLAFDGFNLHAVVDIDGLEPDDLRFFESPAETALRHYPTEIRNGGGRLSGVEHGHIV